jgi:flagellar hook-associated protein 1 FlgK
MISIFDTHATKRTRQQRAIQAAAPILARAGGEGPGIEAAIVAEARDPLLSLQIQAEASVTGALAAQKINLQNAQTCLDELINFSAAPNGLGELEADLAALFNSVEILSDSPDDHSRQRKVVRTAQGVAAKFNRAASRLNCLRNDLNTSIQQDVDRANEELNEIASLNRQLLEGKDLTGKRGLLSEQRLQCLQRLAGRINIIATRRADGGVNVSIGGIPMVLGVKRPDSLLAHADRKGNFVIQAQNAATPLRPHGGSIAGKITARDGGLSALLGGLNSLALQLVNRLNSIYCAGHGRHFLVGTTAADVTVNIIVAENPDRLEATAAAAGSVPTVDVLGQSYAQTVSALSKVSEELCGSQAVTLMLVNGRESSHGTVINDEVTDLRQYQKACSQSGKVHTKFDKMAPML